MTEFDGVVHGLDGGTPLGFLAGVGLQRVLSARFPQVTLAWRLLDAWRPVIQGVASFDIIVDGVLADTDSWKDSALLRFRYLKQEKRGPKSVQGLRAPIGILRAWLSLRRGSGDEEALAYACALMCETATEVIDEPVPSEIVAKDQLPVDEDGPLDSVSMPTFFDFTSRNAYFVAQVEEIRGYLTRDIVSEALSRGQLVKAPRTLCWAPTADTPAAIYTGFEGGSLPVAEWLGFRGLACFPVSGTGDRMITTGCEGRRKQGEFIWPLWEVAAGVESVRTLVAHPSLARLDGDARHALGISTVLRASLTKQADGYDGMFSPARPVMSATKTKSRRGNRPET